MQTIRVHAIAIVICGILFAGALIACSAPTPIPVAPTVAASATAVAQPTVAPTVAAPDTAQPAAKTKSVEFVAEIKDAPVAFDIPFVVDTDAQGNLYVLDNHMRVAKFDPNGKFLTEWGKAGSKEGEFDFSDGGDITIDTAGNVYVVEAANNRIQKFSDTGKFLAAYGSKGNKEGQLFHPEGLSFDAKGNLYISDESNYRIQKWDPNGKFLAQWGKFGTKDGEFMSPIQSAFDASGNFYVADQLKGDVEKFDSDGKFLASWKQCDAQDQSNKILLRSYSIFINHENTIYVIDSNNRRICAFDTDGNSLGIWSLKDYFTGAGMDQSMFMTIDSKGNVYIPNMHKNLIDKFRLQ